LWAIPGIYKQLDGCPQRLDTPLGKQKMRAAHRAPIPSKQLIFLERLEPEPDPQPDPDASCAELVEAGAQHILFNDAVATAAASYVYRLLHGMPLESFLRVVSLVAVRLVPYSPISNTMNRPWLSPAAMRRPT
jgi:hypothetical protein